MDTSNLARNPPRVVVVELNAVAPRLTPQLRPPTHSWLTSKALPLALLQYMVSFFEKDTKKSLRQVNRDWKHITYSCVRRVSGDLYHHLPHHLTLTPLQKQQSCMRLQETLSKLSYPGKACLAIATPYFQKISAIDWKTTNHFIMEFQDFTRLEHVSLAEITDFELERLAPHLTKLKSLTSLKLWFACITNTGLHFLRNLTNLKSLEMNVLGYITDTGLIAFQNLSSLQNLKIRACSFTFTGLAQLKHLPIQNIELEDIGNSTWVNGIVPRPLNAQDLTGFTAVRHLEINECEMENVETLMQISTLETLNLNGCTTAAEDGREAYRYHSLKRKFERKFKIISEKCKSIIAWQKIIAETSEFQLLTHDHSRSIRVFNRQNFY